MSGAGIAQEKQSLIVQQTEAVAKKMSELRGLIDSLRIKVAGVTICAPPKGEKEPSVSQQMSPLRLRLNEWEEILDGFCSEIHVLNETIEL